MTVALISGSVVGKMKYVWFMAFAGIWHLTIYCPLAHWIFFYDGWLFTYGVLDYAGGLVVHVSSGVSALVLAFWLGRARKAHGGGHAAHYVPEAHSVPYVLLGAALLWFGACRASCCRASSAPPCRWTRRELDVSVRARTRRSPFCSFPSLPFPAPTSLSPPPRPLAS